MDTKSWMNKKELDLWRTHDKERLELFYKVLEEKKNKSLLDVFILKNRNKKN